MTFALADLVGYALAIVSFFAAVIIHFRSNRNSDLLRIELKQEIEKRHEDQKVHEKSLESINDIAFSTLLRIKNFPSDSGGMAAQRESFYSALDSIAKITASASKLRPLQGEYVFGSDLGAIENSPRCKEVALFSPDLRPDIDEADLLKSVVENAEKGRVFTYIIPQRTPQSIVDAFLSSLDTYFQKYKKASENITIIRLETNSEEDLFVSGSRALYIMADNDRRTIGNSKLAYAEIVVPDEKRGALWRSSTQGEAQRLYEVLRACQRETKPVSNTDKGAQIDQSPVSNDLPKRGKK